MALLKVAPSTQWGSRKRGASPNVLTLAYDATLDQYYVASGEGADAYLVLDSSDDQYTVNDSRAGTRARIVQVGAAPGRLLQ